MTTPTDSEADVDDDGDPEGYAVVAAREQGQWHVEALPDEVTDDLDDLIRAVRQQPGDDGAFALVDVADEFFVVVRVHQGRVRLLLSDVTAATDWDLAEQVMDHLDLDLPDDDEQEIEPAGDLEIFSDLGLSAGDLSDLLSDEEAYADEMLSLLAQRLGFADEFERVVESV